ncbi:MAG: response regulator transcription factor [Candidatus Dormiibacterota bacterium]
MTPSADPQNPIYRILVADASAMFRRGLTGLLDGHPQLQVVAEATSAQETLELAQAHRPDVAVIDVAVPGAVAEATSTLLRELPGVSILMLSSTGSMVEASRALAGGTSGYVLKQAEPEVLVAAIIAAAHGYAVTPRPVMREMGRAGNPLTPRNQLIDGLSAREFEILSDLAEGMTTKMLASRLHISEKTVRNHIASMYGKLGLHDRSQLVRYAISKGLSPPLEA